MSSDRLLGDPVERLLDGVLHAEGLPGRQFVQLDLLVLQLHEGEGRLDGHVVGAVLLVPHKPDVEVFGQLLDVRVVMDRGIVEHDGQWHPAVLLPDAREEAKAASTQQTVQGGSS